MWLNFHALLTLNLTPGPEAIRTKTLTLQNGATGMVEDRWARARPGTRANAEQKFEASAAKPAGGR